MLKLVVKHRKDLKDSEGQSAGEIKAGKMAGNITTIVKPFDGNGFGNWQFRIQLLLEQNDVLQVLTEVAPTESNQLDTWKKKDLKARNIIVQCISDGIIEMIRDKTTAKDIMDTLRNTYVKTGVASQVQLQRKLRNMKYEAKDSLSEYITDFERTVTELKNAGGKIDNIEIISQLLASISEPEYQGVVTAIDIMFSQQNTNNLTLDFVKSKLLAEEQRHKVTNSTTESSPAAFYGTRQATYKKKFRFKCYSCGKLGHKKADCFKNKRDQAKANMANEETEVSFISCLSNENVIKKFNHNSFKFVVDSGCTNHLVTEQLGQFLVNKREVDHSINVAKAGECVKANYEGTLHLIAENGQKIKLENVFLCKNLTHNLLSVKKMESKGLTITFQNKEVDVNNSNRNTIIRGKLEGNLYVLNLSLNQEFCGEANLTTVHNEKDLWHKRMGHSSKFPPSKVCDICLEGKQTRKPFKKLSDEKKAKRILECVSSDVCGPLNPYSHNGKRYFISFIDQYSHFAVTYFMQHKNEAFQKFKEYVAMVENQFKTLPERVRCDNGGEYISHDMKNFCTQKGIKIEYTIPRTPEQNGVAERFNRTILDKARCLIFQANMDKSFWEEAVSTSIYLTNRTLTSTLPENKVPAEIWYGHKPDLFKIRIFGCLSYVHIPAENRKNKLDKRSQKMYLVGYTNNGYRLWDPDEKRVIAARNVVFDETKMCGISNGISKQEEKNIIEHKDGDPKENSSEETDTEMYESPERRNERPMRIKRTPRYLNDYELNKDNNEGMMAALFVEGFDSPQSFTEAVSKGWQEAINCELSAIKKNETWEVVRRPKDVKVIDSRWVFKQKDSSDGKVIKKARLVARGYQQGHCNDINCYSPVARMMTIRVLLSLSVEKDFCINQLDFKCAFLNGDLPKPVYMEIPEGVKVDNSTSEYVCKLKKSLYGLREAPKCWYQKLHTKLIDLNFKRSKCDPCLYYDNNIYLIVHVDDIILFCESQEMLNAFKSKLMSFFEMHDLSPKCQENFSLKFLGLKIEKFNNMLFLSQTDLIQKVLLKFNMQDCKTTNIPIQVKLNLNSYEHKNVNETLPYRELIGFLMYIMLGTRPDLCYSIYFFSQYQNCFNSEHWKYLKNVLRYLKNTENLGILYKKSKQSNQIISAYVDADFANDACDRKSITGYGIKIFNNFVFWKSKKQATVSLSSSEAEYIALSDCTAECIFVAQLLSELLNVNVFPVNIYEDNQSCIKMSNTLETKRTKHIDVKHHFIRECIGENKIQLFYISTTEQIADIFTKSLSASKFKYFRNLLNVCEKQ